MNISKHTGIVKFLFLLAPLAFLSGCSSAATSPVSMDISNMTELSAFAKNVNAGGGGTITYDEFTAIFPAGVLPVDAQLRVSKALVSNSKQDPALIDMTDIYVLSVLSPGSLWNCRIRQPWNSKSIPGVLPPTASGWSSGRAMPGARRPPCTILFAGSYPRRWR